jgi:uncharacterized membrane protein YtjA (UPF0391 family)
MFYISIVWDYDEDRINKEKIMLNWAVTFLIVAIIAALLGFGGIAGAATEIAKILFFIFLILFLVSLIFGLRARGGGP